MNRRYFKSNYFVWLSLLAHIFILFILLFFAEEKDHFLENEESQYYYSQPNYAYIADNTMPSTASTASKVQQEDAEEDNSLDYENKLISTLPKFDFTHLDKHNLTKKSNKQEPASTLDGSPMTDLPNENKSTEALNMVGEKLLDDPFRKLLGIAITKHLTYPDVARTLHMHGIVSIGFVLHPNGQIADAHILKSSNERLLDIAALDAILASSPIHNVDVYLKAPKLLLVNIIY